MAYRCDKKSRLGSSLTSGVRRSNLNDHSPGRRLGITIRLVLRYGEAGEVDADAGVVETAVERAGVEGTCDVRSQVTAFDILVAADEIGIAEQVVHHLSVVLRA